MENVRKLVSKILIAHNKILEEDIYVLADDVDMNVNVRVVQKSVSLLTFLNVDLLYIPTRKLGPDSSLNQKSVSNTEEPIT